MSYDLHKRIDKIIESHKQDFDFPLHEMAEDLIEFIKKELKLDRDPKIVFENSESNAYNILGKTGYYDPEDEEIHIFVTKRHPKDILRSLAHELIHHAQVCEGKMKHHHAAPASDENYILHDDFLKEMERDAFERGNLIFRKWEAYKKMDIAKHIKEHFARLDEAKKKKKRKLTTKQYNKAKKMATSMEKKQGYDAEKAHKIAFSQVQKESTESCMSENKKLPEKEVEINQVLKDSHYYRPEDRACNETYTARDELIFQEMLKKFGIKK